MRLEPDRVDARVGAAPAGQLAQRLLHVLVLVVDASVAPAFSTASFRRYGKRSIAITRSAPSSFALAIANCPTGPAPHTAITSPGCDVAHLGAHVAGREDVREEQHLLVGQRRRHLERPDVGERHAHVLRLPAGEAADQVRVAERRPHVAWPISFSGIQRVRVASSRRARSCRAGTTRSCRTRSGTARPRDRRPSGSSRRGRPRPPRP